jgi:hypothetical protein
MSRASGATLKLGALLLAIPAGLLGLLLVQNVSTGDPRTLGHVAIEAPLLLAIATLWRRPRLVGAIVILASVAALIANPLTHLSQPWDGIVFVELVIFAPLLIAGLLLRSVEEP